MLLGVFLAFPLRVLGVPRPDSGAATWVDGIFALAALGPATLLVYAQRSLDPAWWRRAWELARIMVIGVGVALSTSLAELGVILGRGREIIRTPKFGIAGATGSWCGKSYALGSPWGGIAEMALGGYCAGTAWVVSSDGQYAVAPDLTLYAAGYLSVGMLTVVQSPAFRRGRTIPERRRESRSSIAAMGLCLLLGACVTSGGMTGVLALIPTGRWPEDVAFDARSQILFVADEGSATVTAIDARSRAVRGTLQLQTRARHLAAGAGRLYAPNELSQFVGVYDGENLMELGRIPTGRNPHGLALDAERQRLLVGNEADQTATLIDTAALQALRTIRVGAGPGGVGADVGSGRGFVVSVKENRVTALDMQTGDILASLPVGAGPTHLAVNSGTGMVYVCNTEANSVTVLDGRALKVRATVPVGDSPFPIAVDETRGRVYVVNNRAATMSVIDGDSLQVVATRPAPRNVSSVALDSARRLLYMTLKSDNRLAVFPALNFTLDSEP
jgi:YVTN family beta-propeller protein